MEGRGKTAQIARPSITGAATATAVILSVEDYGRCAGRLTKHPEHAQGRRANKFEPNGPAAPVAAAMPDLSIDPGTDRRAGCGAQAHHGSDGKRRRQFQTDPARGAIEDGSARQLAWVLRVADCHFRWVASTAKLTSPFPCRTFEQGIG